MPSLRQRIQRKYSQVFNWLQRPDNIRNQTLLSLVWGFVHYQTKRQHDKVFYGDTEHARDCARREQASRCTHQTNPWLAWNARALPEKPKLLVYYQRISTLWMVYVVLKTSKLLAPLVGLLSLELPAHCYLVGHYRISPTTSGNEVVGLFICCCHLAWRWSQRHLHRPNNISLILFLLQSESDIEHFYQLLERQTQPRLLSKLGVPSASDDQRRTNAAAGPLATFEPHHWRDTSCQACQHYETGLCEIMCFKVDAGDLQGFGAPPNGSRRPIYKLRPNRTRESYLKLRRNIASTLISSAAVYLTLAVLLSVLLVLIMAPDLDYIELNPGCDERLEAQDRAGRLERWSITFTRHRVITFVFDLFENLIVWNDTGSIILTVLSYDFLINADLLAYQSHLHAAIERTLTEVKLSQLIRELDQISSRPERSLGFVDEVETRTIQQLDDQDDQPSSLCLTPRRRCDRTLLGSSRRKHEPAIRELQAEMKDLFREIHRADMFVSDTITMALVIWLSLFAIFNYLSLNYFSTYLKADLSIYIRLLMEVCMLIQMVFFGTNMLALHRKCLRTYGATCSLMAHDQSRYKRTFIGLIELFTTGKRYFYTILQEYPYSPTVYLSIIGWSVSCFLLIDDLFIRHAQTTRLQ